MPARFRDLGAPARLAALRGGPRPRGRARRPRGRGDRSRARHGEGRPRRRDGDDRAEPRRAEPRKRALVRRGRLHASRPCRRRFPRGSRRAFRFRILDPSGRATHAFDVDGGVRLHLIVVRRDFVGYQHVHPKPQADGTWSVPLTLAAPGAYRAYADFEVGGTKTVLGHDLFVAGAFTPAPLAAVRGAVRADGFEIALTHAALHANKATKLHFAISRNGKPVPSFDNVRRPPRPPRRASRRRPLVLARASRARREGRRDRLPHRASRPPAATASSSSSRSTASCTPRRSRSRSHDERRRDRAPRAADRGDDLRLVRLAHRAQAEQARRRHRVGQLRDGEGGRRVRPRAGDAGRTDRRRRAGRLLGTPAERGDGAPSRRTRPRRCAAGSSSPRCSPSRRS